MPTKKYGRNIINISQAFVRLKRRVAKCIYYNDDCFIKLRPQEMENIEILLTFLYTDYQKHKDDKKYPGIKQEDLSAAFAEKNKNQMSRERAVKVTAWLLIPQFVNVRSYGSKYYTKDARKYKLNEYGVKLVEMLIEESKKPIENIQQSNTIDEDELEEEEDVSGNGE